ncbi:MAG: hypothetical protein M3069_07170 [Chloroflexota bacterium]|nr:hypothetical protein [Chloroflexota bacterium]
MPARLNRALQVRTADRLRASLARDDRTGLPLVAALSDADQRELREVGGGRLVAIVFRVEWLTGATVHPGAIAEIESVVMRRAAQRVDEHVRRTDLLGSLSEAALVILAPALDPASGRSLAERLSVVFAGLHVQVGELQVQLRVGVGVASRDAASPHGWTVQTLAEEAERTASDLPPIAIVA